MFPLRLLTFAAIAAAGPLACAQYTAGKIIFKNPGVYLQPSLEAVAGIHPHDKVSGPVVQAAAQRLIDTGYFDDVGASLEGPAAAINITFTLKPLDPTQMTRVGFENFVWITPEELQAAVHKAAPLFADRLPEAGNQTEAIATALQAALTAKGVTATVTHEQVEPSPLQPYRVIEYRVSQPAVVVHTVKLQGVSPALAPEVQKVAAAVRQHEYNEGLAFPTTAERLIEPYANAGYLDAKLAGASRTVAETTASAIGVDLSATVDSGEPYHVAGLSFAGTPLISSEAVLKDAKLHTGDLASRKLLLETLAPLDAAYRRQGYMDVFIDTGAKLDHAAHTVSYTLLVVPGQQYRVKTVTPQGLSTAARADFDRGWRMVPGELYDPAYVGNFLKNNTALRALAGYVAGFEASADPQTHQVDLTIKFVRAGG